MTYLEQIESAAAYIKSASGIAEFSLGMTLGTGLNHFPDHIENPTKIPYASIPHLPSPNLEGHEAVCITGTCQGMPILIFAGRLHYYEGFSEEEIAFPIRLMKACGIRFLLMSNVSGGLNPLLKAGDIVCIKDHINFFPFNPLRGRHNPAFGLRFPDMSDAYSEALRARMENIFSKQQIAYKEGVYLGLQGPSLETPAEYKMFAQLGADILGMSTVPEVIVAAQCELQTLVLSIVTNVFDENEKNKKTTLEEVLEIAAKAESKCVHLMRDFITQLSAIH